MLYHGDSVQRASQMQAAGNSAAHPICFFVCFIFLTLNKPINQLRRLKKRDHEREKNVFKNYLRLHIHFLHC